MSGFLPTCFFIAKIPPLSSVLPSPSCAAFVRDYYPDTKFYSWVWCQFINKHKKILCAWICGFIGVPASSADSTKPEKTREVPHPRGPREKMCLDLTHGPCLVPKFSPKFYYAKERFSITSKCWQMHGVLNVVVLCETNILSLINQFLDNFLY
jgi:hypothetical protein